VSKARNRLLQPYPKILLRASELTSSTLPENLACVQVNSHLLQPFQNLACVQVVVQLSQTALQSRARKVFQKFGLSSLTLGVSDRPCCLSVSFPLVYLVEDRSCIGGRDSKVY
jgi:hypothetical protein